ncbi:MAG: proton-conducting transporter membrane subunit [Proteobacteria bacterium]|nr:proton-conducting transporter membrane subunit [Pseudomonadota bacterium]
MSPYIAGYLVIFTPLISAIIAFLLNFSKSNFLIFIASTVTVFFLSLKLFFDVLIHSNIIADLGILPISITTEYNIDLLSIVFLLIIAAIKIIFAFFYKNDIEDKFNKEGRRLFYTLNSLNLFALVGIFTTNNILNLYIFIEIYSFTFYAMSSMSKELAIAKLALRYFCQGVAGSFLILLCIFSLYVITKSVVIDDIAGYITYIAQSNFLISALIFTFLFIGIFLKFFPIWFHFRKVKSNDFIANFLSVSVLFIKINIGIYLLLRLVFFLFGTDFAFSVMRFDILLILLGVALVFYSNIKLLEDENLKVISAYLCLINLAFILIAIALAKRDAIVSAFLYIINLSFVNLLIFCFASYLLRNFRNCEIRYLHIIRKYNVLVGVPLKVIIFFIAGFPLTTFFLANWYLLYQIMDFGAQLFIIIPIITTMFVTMKLAIKMINYFYFYSQGEDAILKSAHDLKTNNFIYLTSFWFILTIAIFFVLNARILTDIGNNLAIYLLY